MTTERQIAANRANATKSTGPVTPEGKRISSQNRSIDKLLSSSADFKGVLKGESLRRYNALSAALTHEFQTEFQPLDAVETALIHSMTVARWRLLCARKIQTTALRREIARARRDHPSKASRATLVAIAFHRLTGNSGSFTRAHRLEAHYDCEYHRALAKLLKLGKTPKSCAAPHRPTQLARTGPTRPSKLSGTRQCPAESALLQQCSLVRARFSKDGETRDCDFSTEANFETVFAPPSEEDLTHRE